MSLTDDNFPLDIKIGFNKLFDSYKELAKSKDATVKSRAEQILQLQEDYPKLSTGLDTPQEVDKFKEQIDFLLLDLFSPVLQSNEIKIASIPFRNYIFKSTKRFDDILSAAGKDFVFDYSSIDQDEYYIMSCSIIMGIHYGKKIDLRRRFHFSIPDAQQIMRKYRVLYNADFIELKKTDLAIDLSEDDIAELLDNFDNIDMWKAKFPPRSWEFNGFVIGNMYDATADVAISDLKATLLKTEKYEDNGIAQFETYLQAIFNLPELKMGYTVFNRSENVLEVVPNRKDIHSYLLNGEIRNECTKSLCTNSYDSLFIHNEYYSISNVDKFHKLYPKNQLYRSLHKQGVKSAILAAVVDNGKVFGVLELASPVVQQLNSVNANKLNDIMPYIVDSIRATKQREENEIELLIQNECTSIHSSVHWKFVNESKRVLAKRFMGEVSEFNEIVFDNVYPLFGQMDIKGSSVARNDAIIADLKLQLTLIKQIIAEGLKLENLPIYEQYAYRIDSFLEQIDDNLQVDSEQKIREFIRQNIKPLFQHFEALSPKLTKTISDYKASLDQDLKLIYKHRKDYDESIMLINKKMAELLDRKQQEAQLMYPHYFERFKTDGVEHNMYIGESITKQNSFSKIYLYNLRLWQLQVMCEMENAYHVMKQDLPLQLDVASMILVFNSALSVRFRMDEKRFDVDGTYNARYEVVKKRVDKAYIKGTTHRITEKGKIVIVYSHKSDEREYLRYIKFLQAKNYLSSKVEIVELEDLQGVTGLKAIRVDVLYRDSQDAKEFYTYSDLMQELGN